MTNIYQQNGLTKPPSTNAAPAAAAKILILNLMPNRAVTEQQFISILSRSAKPHQDLAVTFCLPTTHLMRKHAAAIHAAYTDFARIKDQHFAALIVTGAPLDRIAFTDVDYWPEFQEILAWRHTHVQQSLFLCWGAEAAGYADGVFTPLTLDHKITGVYTADGVTMPQSRYFTIPQDSLTRGQVVAGTDALGALIVADDRTNSTYVSGHFEYFAGTLADEYHRDQRKNGDAAPKPQHYFAPDMRPQATWQTSATKFYTDWLQQLAD
ncbi:homoserine O-acetyltransferase/O-succinyltransferase family protein [Lacticaseibacillus sharpeae]|uniref:Homoserine O-acetyltransferase n=1 Tax=Lacticaseibacillus sharpeae JCM 1186 = DSM 20505 TaxID=1291052 RepID=A0A0R1ZW77_9LACO|nr:homoserine O-succinyltransferase [Lacticaseibacillus sharpeae]KRM55299.1 homoserine O-succinyltransferase [Lacticaseibacillus sharpeae JCM 1186 = DSM 20505]